MIFFLHGPDSYRRLKKKREIVATLRERHPHLSVAVFDLSDTIAQEECRGFLRNSPLFPAPRLAVLEGVDGELSKELEEELRRALHSPDTQILICQDKKPADKKLGFLFKVPATEEVFPVLKGEALTRYLDEKYSGLGILIAPAALSMLSEIYEGNLWAIATELEKLSFLGERITVNDIAVSGVRVKEDFFSTVRAFKGNSVSSRLAALHALLLQQEPEFKIFNIISAMWTEKIPAFARYDVQVKSGRLGYEEVLVDLAIS